jgi:hypothetical protein
MKRATYRCYHCGQEHEDGKRNPCENRGRINQEGGIQKATKGLHPLSEQAAYRWGGQLGSCPACGADLGPSPSFPWHWPDEDCRALRDPRKRERL